MDAKVKNCCSSCSQPYSLTKIQPQLKGRIPLVLKCSHSICEGCVKNIVKFSEPLLCKTCDTEVKLTPAEVKIVVDGDVRSIFPINIFLIGELTLMLSQQPTVMCNFDNKAFPNLYSSTNNFIDVQAIINETDPALKYCSECKAVTKKMCKNCDNILCDICFAKIHQPFHSLRSHVLKNIELQIEPNFCSLHTEKSVDYYCTDCAKPICMDCMLVGDKSCKVHSVISIEEKNYQSVDALKEGAGKVDEIFRRLTASALSIGNLLGSTTGINNTSETVALETKIKQHFSKLHSMEQQKEAEVMKRVEDIKFSERSSLETAKTEVASGIRRARILLHKFNSALVLENIKKVCFDSLLDECKEILEMPWFLVKQVDADDEDINLTVKEEIFDLVSSHIELKSTNSMGYSLLPTKMIKDDMPEAPSKAVFPPNLPRDVRENNVKPPPKLQHPSIKEQFLTQAPKYRAKTESTSSINSIDSDHSLNRILNHGDRDNFGGPKRGSPGNVQTVSPFANHTTPLQEGRNELVYVTHVNDPSDFYVQRSCFQNKAKEMIKEFRNASTFPKPMLTNVTEGKIFLGYQPIDDQWHRCRVINIDREDPGHPIFQVFFIDFGINDYLSIDKLRELSSTRKQCPPPLALHCTLANCQPISGAWSNEDALLMLQIVNSKLVAMHVRKSLGATCYGLALECDITSIEDCVSLVHALVFHERARLRDPNLPYPNLNMVTTKPIILFSNDLKKGDTEDVVITNVISPDKFYVRKQSLQDAYENLMEQMRETYDIRSNTGQVFCPELGMFCVCNVGKYGDQVPGGGWRRAVITALPGKRRVNAFLPDTGHTVILHWTALRVLQQRFSTIKALAIECHLGLITSSSKKWNRGAVELLESHADRVLQLRVEDLPNRSCRSTGVTLYDMSDPENVTCLNQEFTRHKYAIPLAAYNFDHPKTQNIIPSKAPHLNPKKSQKNYERNKTEHIQILKHDEKPRRRNIREDDLDAKEKGPIKIEVKILSCQSPSQIYVSFTDDQEALEQLFERLQTYYSKTKTEGKEKWSEGDICCVLCVQSKTWRRARILTINENKAKVLYTDFAVVEEVPLAEIKIIEQEFLNIHDGAKKCHLSGITPAMGSDWPRITCEYLTELIECYQRFFITKKGAIKDKSLPIELWVYHITAGGALEPNKPEWRKLNDKILEQGLAIPLVDKTGAQPETAQNKDELSFLNVKGSLSEWLQLTPMSEQVAPAPDSSPISSPTPNGSAQPVERLFCDWLPAIIPTDQEFVAVPTFVDNNAIIYLHDFRQEDTLDMIRKSLDARFNNSDFKTQDIFWSTDQPCIALYEPDGHFYRGKVTEVGDDCQCNVTFVDYGNFEFCAVKNLRKNIVMTQIPVQAIRCSLIDIKPINDTWETSALDLLHQIIVERQCFIKVKGPVKDGVLPIDLKVNNNWVSEYLVDLQFALPKDAVRPPPVATKPLTSEESATPQDSDPDYIIDDEDISPRSTNSTAISGPFDIDSIENVDWNKLIEEEENEITNPRPTNLLTYPVLYIPENQVKIECTVASIHGLNNVDIVPVEDKYAADFEKIFNDIQKHGPERPVLKGLYHNQVCIALFSEDKNWYRASVLQRNDNEGLVKVKYVDFGNTEILPIENVRESTNKWCKVPPQCISAKLFGTKLAENVDFKQITAAQQEDKVLDKIYVATVIGNEDNVLVIELRDFQSGQLFHQHLIDKGLAVKVE